jgi:hypothetical protein
MEYNKRLLVSFFMQGLGSFSHSIAGYRWSFFNPPNPFFYFLLLSYPYQFRLQFLTLSEN